MKKFLLGVLLGGIVSGTATYFITKKVMEETCQKDINEIKDHYKKKYEQEKEEAVSAKEVEAMKAHVKKVPDKPVPNEYKELVKNYDTAQKDDEDAPDEYYDDADVEAPPEDRADVEFITIDQYGENPLYNQNCLIYYVNDMTLAYEDGELVDNEKYLIEDALDRDGWRNNDDDEENIYVRNNKISEDFEISKCFGAYGDLN